MKVRIDPHTAARASERGTDEIQIEDVVQTGTPLTARPGRFRKGKVFPFGRERLRKTYPQKRVEVVYVMEQDVAVTSRCTSFSANGRTGNEDLL
jgi:hypothetical protein